MTTMANVNGYLPSISETRWIPSDAVQETEQSYRGWALLEPLELEQVRGPRVVIDLDNGSPVALIATLVVLVVAVFGFDYFNSRLPNQQADIPHSRMALAKPALTATG